MAQRGPGDGRDSPANRLSTVQVTVEPGPGRRAGRAGRVGLRGFAVVVVLGVVVLAVLMEALPGRGRGSRPGIAHHARPATALLDSGPPLSTMADAYRFPLGCLSITLQDARPERAGPCWRYGVYMTAILRRVGGVWRLALEVNSRSCPYLSLPASVRRQVLVCRH